MDQKNIIIAITLSVAILLGFQFFYEVPRLKEQQQLAAQQAAQQPQGDAIIPQPGSGTGTGDSVAAPGSDAATALQNKTRDELLEEDPRVKISSPQLTGSIRLRGGRLDDLVLLNYREEIAPESPKIRLLNPVGGGEGYFADLGWAPSDPAVKVPGADTLWQAEGGPLAPGQDVKLSWNNGGGLTFERIYSLSDNYLFTVKQRVTNDSATPVSLAPYGLISRRGTPETLGFYILHEGLLGVFDGTLKEVDYSDLADEGRIEQDTTGGWIGITDKYWLVALLPDQERKLGTRFVYDGTGPLPKYQTDYIWEQQEVAAGSSLETTNRIFAGAKRVVLLDQIRDKYNVAGLDRAVDFGWFYFLTKPIFYVMHFFNDLLGNFGLAIMALTVCIKLIFFPLANKSYKSMAKMRKLTPELTELRERYSGDKTKLNTEMMQLYKKEKVNPLSGCLPILIQIPVFFALYKVIFVTIEMRHAPFFGWIQDLSAKDPTSIFNLFGLLPYDIPNLGPLEILSLGVWPLVMGFTMWFQQRLNPPPPDKTQAMIFQLMPIFFTFILAGFPAGLVIYWTWNNSLSILQQVVIMKRQGVPIGRMPTKKT